MHAAGSAVVEGLVVTYGEGIEVVFVGHDRGARLCHRVAVSCADFPNIKLMGVMMIDIMPMEVEYTAFQYLKAAIGYFHWSFSKWSSNSAFSVCGPT